MFPPFFCFHDPLLLLLPSFSPFSFEKGADKQAMNGIVVCSAGRVGEVNRAGPRGLSSGARRDGIGRAVGSSTHAEGGLVSDLCE